MDFEFQEDGVIAKILKDAGEKDVAVGSVSQNFSFQIDIGHFGPLSWSTEYLESHRRAIC